MSPLTHAGSCCVTLGEPRNRTSAPDRRVCPSAFAAGFRGYLKSVTAELSEKIMRADAGLSNRVRYLARLIAHYSEFHRIAHFAGNLDSLKVAYANSDAEAKPILLRQFDAIAHQLNMANGVSKTTFADRLENDLAAVLSAVKLPDAELRVLDLPSSTGIACIRSLAQLQERYQITSYVLGDKFHAILYDPCRQCVFDDQGIFTPSRFQPCILHHSSRQRFGESLQLLNEGVGFSSPSHSLVFTKAIPL
jgi:hypothetical protein